MRCGACGAANPPNRARCGGCGANLPEESAPAEGRIRLEPRHARLLLAYVCASSWFGLTGRFLFFASPVDALLLVAAVWSASIFADLIFVAGSVATGIAAYWLGRDRLVGASLLVGFAGTWITYAISWLFVMAAGGPDDFALEQVTIPKLFAMVGTYGVAGLLVGAAAPVIVGLRDGTEGPAAPEPLASAP